MNHFTRFWGETQTVQHRRTSYIIVHKMESRRLYLIKSTWGIHCKQKVLQLSFFDANVPSNENRKRKVSALSLQGHRGENGNTSDDTTHVNTHSEKHQNKQTKLKNKPPTCQNSYYRSLRCLTFKWEDSIQILTLASYCIKCTCAGTAS